MGDIVPVLREGRWSDGEVFVVLEIQGNLLETGGGEHVTVCGWADGVETHRSKDIPG